MERSAQRQILEALIVGSPDPIGAGRLAELVPEGTPRLARELIQELNAEYEQQGRAFEIWEVAGGFQLRSRLTFARFLQQLHPQRSVRLSRPALETLAIVAYNQPITRAEVERIRGVDASPILRALIERKLLRVSGHRDVPGRPMLYATTRRFLEVFGLRSLDDLPTLRDLRELTGPGGVADAPSDPLVGGADAEAGEPGAAHDRPAPPPGDAP